MTQAQRRIFLSYRRDDCTIHAGRLAENLRDRSGDEVFLDIDTINLGENFVKRVEREIARCDVLLVMIGDDWLTVTGRDGRPRIFDPLDHVFLEIRSALERDVPVVPVLVEGASMPRPDQLPEELRELALRNGAKLGDVTWPVDVGRLAAALPTPAPSQDMPTADQGQGKLAVERRERARLDFVAAQAFVDSIPSGHWTSYKEVARAAGAPAGAMAIGSWLRTGAGTSNAWRVLNSRGEVSEGWTPSSDDQPRTIDDVRDRLRGEGIEIDRRGRADPRKRWTTQEAGELGVVATPRADAIGKPPVEETDTIIAAAPHTPSHAPTAIADFPSRITQRFLEQEVSGMRRDQLLAFIAELRRRGWSEEGIYDHALSFSPLQPPNRLPPRITAAWLATNVPLLSPSRIRHLATELRRRGWSSDEIRKNVFEHRQSGLAEEIPARIQIAWLERNSALMTIAEQDRLADIMLERGWTREHVRHYLPYTQKLG